MRRKSASHVSQTGAKQAGDKERIESGKNDDDENSNLITCAVDKVCASAVSRLRKSTRSGRHLGHLFERAVVDRQWATALEPNPEELANLRTRKALSQEALGTHDEGLFAEDRALERRVRLARRVVLHRPAFHRSTLLQKRSERNVVTDAPRTRYSRW